VKNQRMKNRTMEDS